MEKKITEQESIAVINSMIAQARNSVAKGAGNYMLLWGYVVALASLVHFIWIRTGFMAGILTHNLIWGVAVSAGVVLTLVLVLSNRRKKEAKVKTYTGSIGSMIWIGFGVCALSLGFLLGGKTGTYFIYPAISFIYTYALFLSAKTYRYNWLYISVAVCAVCVVIYKFVPGPYYPLLMFVMMLVGNIIPGHIINYKGSHNV